MLQSGFYHTGYGEACCAAGALHGRTWVYVHIPWFIGEVASLQKQLWRNGLWGQVCLPRGSTINAGERVGVSLFSLTVKTFKLCSMVDVDL